MLQTRDLGGLPWLVLSGDAETCFAELGRACADRIRTVIDSVRVMAPLRERAERSPSLPAVLAASRRTPAHAELVALAAGAGVEVAELELLNLRGDLGTDGLGCTDVALRTPDGLVAAHNEDNDATFDCVGVTLAIDGRAPVWVFWTPGMVPANTYVVSGAGLVDACDSVTVRRPADAPGRHFVARGLAECPDLGSAVAYLTEHPSAGGFHHGLVDWRAGAYAGVEAAAGRVAVLPEAPVQWHTNHLRGIAGLDRGSEDSRTRARTAEGWRLPAGDPVEWCLDQLARRPMPDGVLRPGATLGTLVLDCRDSGAELTLIAGGRPPVRVAVADLLG